MSVNATCPLFTLGDGNKVCLRLSIQFITLLDSLIFFLDAVCILAFSRFIFVLVSHEARRSIEYTIRIQVLHTTIAHNLLFILGMLLTNDLITTKFGKIFNQYVMIILFTFSRTVGGLFSFLMGLTRLTAITDPLRQNEIWTKRRLWMAISAVWIFTGIVACVAAAVHPKLEDLNLVDAISPVFIMASILIYVIIVWKVRTTLRKESRNKSFFRCLSRITFIAFIICIADLIVPLSRVLEKWIFPSYTFHFNMTIEQFERFRTQRLISITWNGLAMIICNSLAVWMFILSVPKFRYLFFGKCCRPSHMKIPTTRETE